MGRPRQTRLISILSLAYEMDVAEQAQIAKDILDMRISAWRSAVAAEARSLGYSGAIAGPRGRDLAGLKRQSDQDAAGIRDTYNREVFNRLVDLFNSNRRGNRTYYDKNMSSYLDQRGAYKARQIANVSITSARNAGREAFRKHNKVRGTRYTIGGPAPVNAECVRRFKVLARQGTLDQDFVDRNPFPVHPNCPHDYEEISPGYLPSGVSRSDIWTG